MTFNYTNIAELKFPIPEGQIHYIHGKENFINSSVEETNLVFGIEDNNENINKDIIEKIFTLCYTYFTDEIVKYMKCAHMIITKPGATI